MADHSCTQGPRFDVLEGSVAQVHEKLDKITDLLVANARTDEKLTALSGIVAQHTVDLKACTEFMNKNTRMTDWMDLGFKALIILGLVAFGFIKGG